MYVTSGFVNPHNPGYPQPFARLSTAGARAARSLLTRRATIRSAIRNPAGHPSPIANHLPVIADQLTRALAHWGGTGQLAALASKLSDKQTLIGHGWIPFSRSSSGCETGSMAITLQRRGILTGK